MHEVVPMHQLRLHCLDTGKGFFIAHNRLFHEDAPDALLAPSQVVRGQHSIVGNGIEERTAGTALLIDFRDDIDMIHLLFRELGLNIEGTDSLYLISKEVNTIGIFAREGEDVEDTTAHGVLPRLINIIDPLESVAVQNIGHEHIVQLLARMDLKRVLFQHVAGYDLLGQRVGIGYNHKLLLRVLQDTQGFCSQYLVRRVDMPILNIPPVGRGEEIDGRTCR